MNSRTIFALIATLSLGFAVACGSDDDDAIAKDDNTNTGSYDGSVDSALCGNGQLDGNEWCDTSAFATEFGDAPVCSEADATTMTCTSGCLWDSSACTITDLCEAWDWYSDLYCDPCEIMGGHEDPDCASCGDGFAANDETGAALWEDCDTNDVHGYVCTDAGFSSGTLKCDEMCQYDFNSCVE